MSGAPITPATESCGKVYTMPVVVVRQEAEERKVKVEVLYVADCPSHPAAVKLVKEVLAAEGVTAEIREVLVSNERMAGELKFLGSPTIRINGQDVAPTQKSRSFALSCRLYPGSKRVGVPPADLVRIAVLKALGNRP